MLRRWPGAQQPGHPAGQGISGVNPTVPNGGVPGCAGGAPSRGQSGHSAALCQGIPGVTLADLILTAAWDVGTATTAVCSQAARSLKCPALDEPGFLFHSVLGPAGASVTDLVSEILFFLIIYLLKLSRKR